MRINDRIEGGEKASKFAGADFVRSIMDLY
jgi:hypothetical protein